MNLDFNPLPDLKQQFVAEHYQPVERECFGKPVNMQAKFEMAKERYEQQHGHRFPYSFTTFCKTYYGS